MCSDLLLNMSAVAQDFSYGYVWKSSTDQTCKKRTLIWTPTVVTSFTLPLSLTCLFSLPLFSVFREWGAKALQRIHAGHQKCSIKLDSSFALCNKQNSFHNLVPLQNLDVNQLKKNFLGRLPTALI